MRMNWKDRISQSIKDKVNLDMMVYTFKRKIEVNEKNGMPYRYARMQARLSMIKLLVKKNIANSDIVHLLHVCEVLPYSGCGCCEHRKPTAININYENQNMYN